MQTFLVISSDDKFITGEVEKLKKKYAISAFNLHEIIPSPSIGIEEVRNIQKIFIVKPYGEKNRLVILREMEKATIEAQNALLKILEEPPNDTYLLLTCGNKENLLPTILSRCQLINQINAASDLSNFEKTEKFLKSIFPSTSGKRIILIQETVKTKEEGIGLLADIINFLEKSLHRPPKEWPVNLKETAQCLSKTLAAKKYLERNINWKATLDILFLGFPGTH
ncbi:hypothetical protein MUP32_04535 [Candidatus Microgenomates bacterium]|nr:hypothetical protein [Candidatus Microgenomates bacterium]